MRFSIVAMAGCAALGLAGCAGTPPPGAQASAQPGTQAHHQRCDRSTGSMLCGNSDDEPYASANAPGSSTPRTNTSQAAGGRY